MSETPEPIIVRHTLSRESVPRVECECKPLTGQELYNRMAEILNSKRTKSEVRHDH